MLPLVTGLLFSLWFLFAYRLLASPAAKVVVPGRKLKGIDFLARLPLDSYQAQAEAIGWRIARKELVFLIVFTFLLAVALAILVHNPLVVVVGVIAGFYGPKFLIEKKRHNDRIYLLSRLTDPMRMLVSRLPDLQNITKAMEQTRDEIGDERVRELFDGYLKDVAIGGSVHEALLNLKRKIKLRKYDIFVEYLIQAHYEGFTAEALQALSKAIEAIEFDLRAMEKVKETSRNKKRSLYSSLGIAWFFPFILSMANTGTKNIYLETVPGKILILGYIVGSLYVLIKGEEYLSLNLDEL